MSVNVIVAVPLDLVVAMRQATKPNAGIITNATTTSQTTRAVFDAVKALPYDITPTSGGKRPRSEAVESDSDDEIPEPKPKQVKTGRRFVLAKEPALSLVLQTYENRYDCVVDPNAPFKHLADAYADRKGTPVNLLRFYFDCSRFPLHTTPAQNGMEDGDTIEVFPEIVGS